MWSHAQVPFTQVFESEGFVRFFFSTRSAREPDGFKSYSGYVDLEPQNQWKQRAISAQPILDLGGSGSFDEFGIMAGSMIAINGLHHLYYCGWQRMWSVPYQWSIGLATSEDGVNFTKYSIGPIVAARVAEPFLHACPIVMSEDAGYRMFYLSGDRWIKDRDGKFESVYTLRSSYSTNGIDWGPGDRIIPSILEDECQTSASLFSYNGDNYLLYSYRAGLGFRGKSLGAYRLGLAKQVENSWRRVDDELVVEGLTQSDWANYMAGYPHVFQYLGTTYMLFCGNNFGESGFGVAELCQ